jgi:hypothetical protein
MPPLYKAKGMANGCHEPPRLASLLHRGGALANPTISGSDHRLDDNDGVGCQSW